MKNLSLLILLLLSIHTTNLQAQSRHSHPNRFTLGLALEESSWFFEGETPEFIPRLGIDALVPCGQHFSLGAFAGYQFLSFDGGLLTSWRFDNQSRVLLGAGYSGALWAPVLRLGYQLPCGLYFSGWVASEVSPLLPVNLSLGIGYAFFGGRRGWPSKKQY